ncbi:MAG: RluA family pseudouridine synthase, partial [Actinobacteria bacterium]|nr:RluA family pseudouridine synthase [Actinomycetota bacterium]
GSQSFEAEPGRLDRFLTARLAVARAEVQRAIAEGRVTVDGRPRPKSHQLQGGERIEVELGDPAGLSAEGPPVEVRHEDEWLLVVAKPAGLPTHPTAGRRTGSLVNRLLGMEVPLAPAGGPERPGIVHRLDAGTSGLLIVAKDDETHVLLQDMFRRHEVERTYLAVVRGSVEHDRFAVNADLARAGPRIVVRPGAGRASETLFTVRERFERATLLEASPRTGRTHQIRVHLSSAGHPILGDRRYGGGGDDAKAVGLSRPFLHAWRIRFIHPRTGATVEAEEPLPEELAHALERLGPPAGRLSAPHVRR